MTTTTLFSGHDGKSSSRVLRPPGGGSSNIFGTEEPTPQQQQRQQQREHCPSEPAPASGASSGQPAPAPTQNQQAKQRAEAPFASFAESGKLSDPSQFDKCGTESQNEADFRCYSVTAYREAVATNAAVKQRARGQATGAFNPITHEEKSDISPFQAYEQARVHPQQMAQQASRPNRRPVGPSERAVQYNPITGEEYPADYGQKKKDEEVDEEEDQEQEESKENSEANTPEEKTLKPEETQAPAPEPRNVKKPSTRVRQPPGGASAGLW